MTARPPNAASSIRVVSQARDGSEPVVVILKKTQGSVWSETARTALCPTRHWLRATYGAGTYELRLKQGNRILCITLADCSPAVEQAPATAAEERDFGVYRRAGSR